MVAINGHTFYEEPGSCGTCPFLFTGATQHNPGDETGHCTLWNEHHKRWRSVPRRCERLFRNAFANYDGRTDLVVTGKLKDN